jgi:Protein of unknown function (DUF2877)
LSPTAVIAAERVGYALDVDRDCVGAVHSVFSRAVNLEIEGEMWTLLASDCADLPLGIRLPVPSFEAFAIRQGGSVHARAGFLGIGRPGRRIVVDCGAAPRWAPSPPSAIAPGFAARLARLSQAATARAWFASRTMACAATRALQSGARPLGGALAGIVGCGPGLTPAGDDVLVGILAVLTSPVAGDAGAETAEAMRRAIEGLAPRTTTLSGHMLRQAARGLLGRMPHDLVSALAGAAADELDCAIRSIAATGATSGVDVCMGVLEAARAFLRSGAYEAAA